MRALLYQVVMYRKHCLQRYKNPDKSQVISTINYELLRRAFVGDLTKVQCDDGEGSFEEE